MPKIIPVDFETHGIMHRPEYPPVPVGVAIKWEGKRQYLAWGHPTENNCTKAKARKILLDVFRNHIPLFHNAAFDIYVGMEHLGLPFPKIDFHDTLFLAYLHDPRDRSLSLKPLADKYLNMPPQEQEELYDWILKHVFVANGIKPTKQNPLGAHIAEAPGKLVGKYAKGDIIRTEKLFDKFYKYAKAKGMLKAYEREKKVMPIFEEMSQTGIKIAVNKLKKDSTAWKKENLVLESKIKKILKNPDVLLTSNKQLAAAMDAAGKIGTWVRTAKGNNSTSRENLQKACKDKKLLKLLAQFGVMNTFIGTFADPWLAVATKHGGRVYPNFNQVRTPDDHKGNAYGTRTGRPSSNNPNFLNVPRDHGDPDVPWMRNYILPDDGCIFSIRDYSQQEMRILAHYEEGSLFRAYSKDPKEDAHVLAGNLMTAITGKYYDRDPAKVMNFGTVYGMGLNALAGLLKSDTNYAAQLRKAYYTALPDIKQLINDIQNHSKAGNPIYTWGGREYFAEEPTYVTDEKTGFRQKREYHYKLTNYLIQGSGADCTKEAMIRVDEAVKPLGGRVVLQVYDELVVCIPKEHEKQGIKLHKEAMESIEFDVPMLSDGKVGRRNWGQAKKLPEGQ